MAFPIITLASDFVVQPEIRSNSAQIISQQDDVVGKCLRVMVEIGGNKSAHYWVTVCEGDNYTVDWTNAQVLAAVAAHFANA